MKVKRPIFSKLFGTLFASATLAVSALAPAQAQSAANYPDRAVKVIVAAATGSSPDSIGRLVAHKLSEKWGQSVLIENVAGLGGIIGTERAAKQTADGYTLLLSTIGGMSVGVSVMDNLPYDPVKDFEPITMAMSMPNLFVVHPSVPVKTVEELIAYIKANPGKLRYGHPGAGTTGHLSGEMLKQQMDIEMLGIPYKSSSHMTTDLLAGHFEVLFHNSSVLLPHVRSGAATGLGVTSLERVAAMPDIPTLAESGMPGFSINAWWGFYAPAGTPAEIVKKVNADINAIIAEPEVQAWITERMGIPGGGTPEELATFQASETKKWAEVIKNADIPTEQ
ncbi:tripartite tricarboxylate transporter substrate binding protein [Alcaligenaceae bacterium]|nr:tripartite tricarboxylate transporter substrate binding protein [Alcaligenaceae bacterium]